jgi:hypothetical protein
VSGSLDEVWRTVRGVLGTAARDTGAAVSAWPARVSDGLDEIANRAVQADVTIVPDPATTSLELPGLGTTPRSSLYVPGRDLLDELDYTALRRARGTGTLGASPTFEEIQRLQGFDGPLTIATSDEVDAAVAAGGKELFRGFEEQRYIDAFVTGPVRPGGGTTGAGTYATPVKEVALHYTDPTRKQDLATRQSRVVRMALRPEARTVTLRELETERSRTQMEITRELRVMRDIANPTAEDTARYTALLDKELTFTDIGHYGAVRGWDAIDGSDIFSNKEWAVPNPTALLIQR